MFSKKYKLTCYEFAWYLNMVSCIFINKRLPRKQAYLKLRIILGAPEDSASTSVCVFVLIVLSVFGELN